MKSNKAFEQRLQKDAPPLNLIVIRKNKWRIFMSEHNPFIWQELVTSDQETSGTFFSKLFDWTLKKVDAGKFGTYTLFQKNGEDVAGMMNPTMDTPGKGSYWHSYIAVDDIDDCATQTEALGGEVIVPPHDVPDVSRVCAVSDPTGAVIHLMQPVENK